MTKFTPSLGLTLVALTLTSQVLKADDCQFTPNALPGQAADRTELEVNATVQVGNWGRANGNLSNLNSTNADAVYLFRGTTVYFVGAGTSDVTYTETNYSVRPSCSTDHTVHYTVVKGTPTGYFAGQDGAALTEYNLVLSNGGSDAETGGGSSSGGAGGVTTGAGGADGGGGSTPSYWTPSLVMKIQSFDTNRNTFIEEAVTTGITYASSNPDVAEIDANTGAVTVKGSIGETTISATWGGNANWKDTTVSYKLVAKKQAVMYFSPGMATDTVGNVRQLNLVINSPGVQVDAYESSNTEVATVDNEGKVTMQHFGNVTIDAVFNGNDEYHAYRCRFHLTVSKRKPHIAFAQTSVKMDSHDVTPALPALVKPDDMSDDQNKYTWRSTNTSVIYIDTYTGEFSIERETGYAQIQCFFAGDDKYLPDTARCDVQVTTTGITIMGHYVKLTDTDIFGDGSVVYTQTIEGPALELNQEVFDANGGTFIQATQMVRLLVKCNCRIKNATTAIQSTSAVFIWCQNRKDSITISASQAAISAGHVKVHDCYLFASGNAYGLNTTGGISVSAGGYIFAQGGTEAIRARDFVKGENAIGGVNVLTKGVSFVSAVDAADHFGGFYTDYPNNVKAKYVEIGKVPLPIANDAVTSISFVEEEDNPYDNLKVVFAESEADKFNEADKQIEMASQLTDDQVNQALVDHEPCSSEWKKELPGTLIFDVPEGEGKVQIECQTADDYELAVKVVGEEGTTTIVQEEADGSAEVNYDVEEQTHVIVYLRERSEAPEQGHAPARVRTKLNDAPKPATIKAITITPKGTPTAIDQTPFLSGEGRGEASRIILRDGMLLIEREGKTYTITGARLR